LRLQNFEFAVGARASLPACSFARSKNELASKDFRKLEILIARLPFFARAQTAAGRDARAPTFYEFILAKNLELKSNRC
jgi:hypothetical protein